jgi:hypothetical protein
MYKTLTFRRGPTQRLFSSARSQGVGDVWRGAEDAETLYVCVVILLTFSVTDLYALHESFESVA